MTSSRVETIERDDFCRAWPLVLARAGTGTRLAASDPLLDSDEPEEETFSGPAPLVDEVDLEDVDEVRCNLAGRAIAGTWSIGSGSEEDENDREEVRFKGLGG